MNPATEPQQWDQVLEAGKSEHHYWRDMWRYRELLWFLAWRDILVRYKQTIFGVAWSVLRPALTMIAFTIVFGRVAKLPSDGLPYPVLVYAGLLPWQFFSFLFLEMSESLVANSGLVGKVYFPRLIVPISRVPVGLLDFGISFFVYLLLMGIYHVPLTLKILSVPFFLTLAFLASLGPGLLIASLNVKYRDFRHIVPFIVQFGLFVSPVGFSTTVIPDRWKLLYSLNPLVGVIDGFRWALLGSYSRLPVESLLISMAPIALLLVAGIAHFRATEKQFADVI